MDSVNDIPLGSPGLSRQISHHHLNKFKEAKTEISSIYDSMSHYMTDCYGFTRKQMEEEKFARILGDGTNAEVEQHLNKIRNIQHMISRNQMKCAFFGRTSNGKSTVINAMLGSKILPSGLGHTTSCFLQIQGTDSTIGYLTKQGSPSIDRSNSTIQVPKSHPVESVKQLAHALSGEKLSIDSTVCIFWPSGCCRLLREDVVLLDSPGINVDPDMDKWIDSHCLDADLFVLVANAESTLMQAEKDFFHRVSERLSKPNIFIVNNRWDASANEIEFVNEVREQHLQRCVSFLSDELKVCSHPEAEHHVFFISAREALAMKEASVNALNSVPPGSVSTPGIPHLAEGWEARLEEFKNFEVIFEKNLSESATRTKFATHCEQGKSIAEHFRSTMEHVYETSVEEHNAAIRCRCLSQARLEEVRTRLVKSCQALEEMLHTCLAHVEARVSNALNAEIRRLDDLVENYTRPFHPDPTMLQVYKKELNTHVERELGRKISDACASDIINEVVRAEQTMMHTLSSIVSDELHKSRILQLIDPTTFTPEFHVDCRNLCADFREDIQFRFSLSPISLFHRMTNPRRLVWGSWTPWATGASGSSYRGSSNAMLARSINPLSIELFPSLLSRNTVGAAVVFGLVFKSVGWRVLGMAAGLYMGLYCYERLAWTNKAKETTFKRQYVDFASHKLRLIVDLTSTNARHQVKRELQLAQKRLSTQVETFAETLVDEVKLLDEDIHHLESITTESKSLKNRASTLLSNFNRFHQVFIANLWLDTG